MIGTGRNLSHVLNRRVEESPQQKKKRILLGLMKQRNDLNRQISEIPESSDSFSLGKRQELQKRSQTLTQQMKEIMRDPSKLDSFASKLADTESLDINQRGHHPSNSSAMLDLISGDSRTHATNKVEDKEKKIQYVSQTLQKLNSDLSNAPEAQMTRIQKQINHYNRVLSGLRDQKTFDSSKEFIMPSAFNRAKADERMNPNSPNFDAEFKRNYLRQKAADKNNQNVAVLRDPQTGEEVPYYYGITAFNPTLPVNIFNMPTSNVYAPYLSSKMEDAKEVASKAGKSVANAYRKGKEGLRTAFNALRYGANAVTPQSVKDVAVDTTKGIAHGIEKATPDIVKKGLTAVKDTTANIYNKTYDRIRGVAASLGPQIVEQVDSPEKIATTFNTMKDALTRSGAAEQTLKSLNIPVTLANINKLTSNAVQLSILKDRVKHLKDQGVDDYHIQKMLNNVSRMSTEQFAQDWYIPVGQSMNIMGKLARLVDNVGQRDINPDGTVNKTNSPGTWTRFKNMVGNIGTNIANTNIEK